MRESQIDTAIEFLLENVAGVKMPAVEVYRLAKANGISLRTLERAKSSLGINSMRVCSKWFWVMPGDNFTTNKSITDSNLSLTDTYVNQQKQIEFTVVEMQEVQLPKEIQKIDMSKFKRIFLICGLSGFSGKFDSFALRVPQYLETNMIAGDAFVFSNWQKNQISILQWQGDGFAQYFKRSDYGRFPWPIKKDVQAIEISPKDLKMLLEYPKLMMRISGVNKSSSLAGKDDEIVSFA